jgi:ribosomal-protein-alanine acetyltransferase
MPGNDQPFSDPTDSGESPVFRECASGDEAAIGEIFREASLSLQVQNPGATQTAISSTGQSAATHIQVCESKGEVVGVMQWRQVGPEAEILDVAVAEAHRRQGHAKFLLQRFVELAAKNGVREIFLEVRESNAAAIALYTKFGFSQVGCRPNYYQHPSDAALLLKRKLTG